MASDLHDIGPRDRWNLLSMMQESPAFALFCAQHDKIVAALEKEIFDTSKPDAEVRELRLVRARLVEKHDPRKVMQNLIIQAKKEAENPKP